MRRGVTGGWVVSGFATGDYAAALGDAGDAAAVDTFVAQLSRVLPVRCCRRRCAKWSSTPSW